MGVSALLMFTFDRSQQDQGVRLGIVSLVLGFGLQAATAVVNPTPKALMPLLVPATASDEVKPEDFKDAQRRMIGILEFLIQIDGSNGRRAQDTVVNAFYIYDRHRFSGQRRMMTTGAILRNFETAKALGLFDEGGKFDLRIRLGREKGKTAKFEYIVPAGKAPAFSTDLANLRLVTPETMRQPGAPFTAEEQAYLDQLDTMKKEVLFGRDNELGRTQDERRAIWQAEVDRAGGEKVLKEAPSIRLAGSVTATPSGKSGQRWRVSYEVQNFSHHPTQVEAEFFIFGISGPAVEDKVTLLSRRSQTLSLRLLESRDIEVWTGPRVGNTRMRGWAVRVLHEGKEIGWTASQPIIYDYVKRVDTIPKATAKKKRKSGRK